MTPWAKLKRAVEKSDTDTALAWLNDHKDLIDAQVVVERVQEIFGRREPIVFTTDPSSPPDLDAGNYLWVGPKWTCSDGFYTLLTERSWPWGRAQILEEKISVPFNLTEKTHYDVWEVNEKYKAFGHISFTWDPSVGCVASVTIRVFLDGGRGHTEFNLYEGTLPFPKDMLLPHLEEKIVDIYETKRQSLFEAARDALASKT